MPIAPKIPKFTSIETDSKAWAKRLQKRHLAGENLCEAQISAYRAALGLGKMDKLPKVDMHDEEERRGMAEF